MLNISDHSRDSAGMKYVYPVISRRAGGVSVGINLNVNNACNWACVYCQVPGLTRGGPPPVDLDLLESELRELLRDIATGDFLIKNVPLEARRLIDVAFSGNGEPTSSAEFAEAIERVGQVMGDLGLLEDVKLRLITNGSLMHRPIVRQGVARIGSLGGEVWFKVDRATETGIERVNGVRVSPVKVGESLAICAALAPTWIQSCFFLLDGLEAEEAELTAYLAFVEAFRGKIKGVHLYGIARPSMQPDANRLSALSRDSLESFGRRIASLGVEVTANT